MSDHLVFPARRANLELLVSRYASQREFAQAANVQQPSVSQVLRGTRNLGEALARRIERNLGLPPLWMDHAQSADIPLTLAAQLAATPARPTLAGRRAPEPMEREASQEEQEAILAELHSALVAEGLKPEDIDSRSRVFTPFGAVRADIGITHETGATLVDLYKIPGDAAFLPHYLDRILATATKIKHAYQKARYVVIFWGPSPQPSAVLGWVEDTLPRISSYVQACRETGLIWEVAYVTNIQINGLPTLHQLAAKIAK